MKGVHTRAQTARTSDHTTDATPEIDHSLEHQEGLSMPPQASQQSKLTTMEKVSNGPAQLSIHPYAGAKDAVYIPPTTENITAKLKPSPPKKANAPLKTFTPVYDPQIALDVYTRSMNAQVTLTQCELLSLSPEVWNQVQEATSS